MSVATEAGRELFDHCLIAKPDDPHGLAFSMATLLSTPEYLRTLGDLDHAGIFIDPSRRPQLSPQDADLLMSDKGLLLWLQYAASPTAYPKLFRQGPDCGEAAAEPPEDVLRALRVLIACGRDKTNDAPRPDGLGGHRLPLAHVCSQAAPGWLSSLLSLGVNPNQLTAKGIPLMVTAMAAEADRLHTRACDLLVPQASLYRLGKMLHTQGARVATPAHGSAQFVALLAMAGFCAAAEVLLGLGTLSATSDVERHDNTLLHQLASATQVKQYASTAAYFFTIAMRYGGDPDQANHAGISAISLLPEGLAQYVRQNRELHAQAYQQARHVIALPEPKTAEESNGSVPPISAAFMAQARHLCHLGHNPLLPHESLFALGTSLNRNGVRMSQMHEDGSSPAFWLAMRGYCGAAEVLLSLAPQCNVPGAGGNTLMHMLANATHHSRQSALAEYMLNIALRYGGDPAIRNEVGDSALTSLTSERICFVRKSLALVTQARDSAIQAANRRSAHHAAHHARHAHSSRLAQRQPGATTMRHSAAAL